MSPDISMCNNDTCPLKNKCYRFTAVPDTLQSYIYGIYKDGKCVDYWENNGKADIHNYKPLLKTSYGRSKK